MNTFFMQKMRSFLVIAIVLFAWAANAQKIELNKKIAEKYQVTSNDELSISNKYGNVTVNTWAKNEITVDVVVKAWAKSEDDAQELLDKVEIEYGKSGNTIAFETNIASSKWVNNNNKSGFEINYTINMPTNNSLELSNKYGAVHLADFAGKLDLAVGYGDLSAGVLTNEDISISLKYSSKGKIESVNKGSLEFRYSSNISIEKVGKIALSDKYGGVSIGEAGRVDAKVAYSSLKIGVLHHSLLLDAQYSNNSVAELKSGFDKVYVDTSYGSFSLGTSASTSFDFEVETSYGGFKYGEDIDLMKQIERNNSGTYAGSKGTGKKGSVKVESSYGSVKFQ